MTTTIRRMAVLLTALALLATACGGKTDQTPAEVSAALDTATANFNSIATSDNLADTEMLNVRDGEIVSLSDVITGDRAVLLWYWAPH